MSASKTAQAKKTPETLSKKVSELVDRIPPKERKILVVLGAFALTAVVLSIIALPFFASEATLKEISGFIINSIASFVAFVIALSITIVAVAILAIGLGYPPSTWNLPKHKRTALTYLSRGRSYLSTLRAKP